MSVLVIALPTCDAHRPHINLNFPFKQTLVSYSSKTHKVASPGMVSYKTRFWITTILIYASSFTSGMTDCIKSVTVVDMKLLFGADDSLYSLLLSVVLIGYMLSSATCSFSVAHFGYRTVLTLGLALCYLGDISSMFINSFQLGIVTQFVAMAGVGMLDNAVGSLCSKLFVEHSGVYMSYMSFFYGIGATVGPLIAGWIDTLCPDYTFRAVYLWISFIPLLVAIVTLLAPLALNYPNDPIPTSNDQVALVQTEEEQKVEPMKEAHSVKEDLLEVAQYFKDPMIYLYSVTCCLLMMVDRAALSWSGNYFVDYLHLDLNHDAALFNSLYYGLSTITRIFGGFIADYLGYYCILYITLGVTLVLYIVGFSTGIVGIWIICSTGIFISFYYSIFLCLVIRFFESRSALATSVILPIESLLVSILTLPLGYLNDYCGAEWAFRSTIVFVVLSMAFVGWLHSIQLKKDKKSKPEV